MNEGAIIRREGRVRIVGCYANAVGQPKNERRPAKSKIRAWSVTVVVPAGVCVREREVSVCVSAAAASAEHAARVERAPHRVVAPDLRHLGFACQAPGTSPATDAAGADLAIAVYVHQRQNVLRPRLLVEIGWKPDVGRLVFQGLGLHAALAELVHGYIEVPDRSGVLSHDHVEVAALVVADQTADVQPACCLVGPVTAILRTEVVEGPAAVHTYFVVELIVNAIRIGLVVPVVRSHRRQVIVYRLLTRRWSVVRERIQLRDRVIRGIHEPALWNNVAGEWRPYEMAGPRRVRHYGRRIVNLISR